MNVRLSILLLVVLALVGGSVLITRQLSTREPKDKVPWLFKLNMEDITKISVVYGDQRMDYAFTGDEWVMKDGNDSLVFTEKWAGTTLLLSGPRSDRALADEIDDPAKYGLDSPQTMVQVFDKSGFPIEFHLGNATPNGLSWYARLVGSDQLFTVASIWGEVISKLATKPPYLPFKFNMQETTRISVGSGDKRVEYARTGDEWLIKDGNDTLVSTEKWADTALLLNFPSARRAPQDKIDDPAKYGLDPPQVKVTIVREDRTAVAFDLGYPVADGRSWYARVSGSDKLFVVASIYGEAVSRLATDPPYPPDTEAPAKDVPSAAPQEQNK